jgi:transcriptional regulator with XRE-family HTH domain
MKERILEFLRIENKSSAQLADEIGVQPSSISHIISGRNNPSLDFVLKMLGRYPSLSSDWLLFGRGNMYNDAKMHDLFAGDDNILSEKPENQNIKSSSRTENSLNFDLQGETGDMLKIKAGMISKRTKRIVCFHEDGTFTEYFPA